MKIKGKEVNTRFGMLAVEIFLQKSIDIGVTTYSAFGLASIIYAGAVNYYSVKELAVPVSFEDVYDHVENEMLAESEMEEIKQAVKDFEESQALKKKTADIEKVSEEVKKKMLTSENLPTNQDLNPVSTNG
jgi:hypothetical protein